MDVKFDGTSITLTPAADELPTVVWMFSRADGPSIVKFIFEQFVRQRNDQLVSEQKESLFVDAVNSGVVSAPIARKVTNG